MINSKRQVNDPYMLLAFYGIDSSPDSARHFYDLATGVFERFDCPPNKAGVCGDGFSGALRVLPMWPNCSASAASTR